MTKAEYLQKVKAFCARDEKFPGSAGNKHGAVLKPKKRSVATAKKAG